MDIDDKFICVIQDGPCCDDGSAIFAIRTCEAPVPAGAFDYETCAGLVPSPANAKQVALAPGQVVYTKRCPGDKDFEKVIMCDKVTGNKVVVITAFNLDDGTFVTTYYDLVAGAAYAGTAADLEACPDSDTESDRVKGCDGGVPVSKWVLKVNGEPTGTVYYTDDTTNAVITPVAWTEGSCDCIKIYYEDTTPLPGLYNKEWDTGQAATPGGDVDVPYSENFINTFNFNSTPLISNVVTANTFLVNDANNTVAVQDIQLRYGYIIIDTPTYVRWSSISEGYIQVKLGLNNTAPSTVISVDRTGTTIGFTPSVLLPVGTHRIEIYNFDNGGASSVWSPQVSTDNISFSPYADYFDDKSFLELVVPQCLQGWDCNGTYYNLDKTEILVDPVFCNPNQLFAQVPNCAGTLDDKPVDSIVGAYLLNQENKHTEVVYDSVLATIGGSITYTYTAPHNILLSHLGVTVTNDTLLNVWTDFGDGYNDVGSSPDHTYNSDGVYEIKSYLMLNSRTKILIAAKEVTILNGVVTYSGVAGSQAVSRNYSYSVSSAFQDFCGNLPVGTPYTANGTAYTPVGTITAFNRPILDELEDNADFNVQPPVPSVEYEPVCVFDASLAPVAGTYYEGILVSPDGTGASLGYFSYTVGSGYLPYTLPAGFTIENGCCEDQTLTLKSGGVSIANGIHATLLGPDGATWNNPGNLKSVTIKARKSNDIDAVPGSGANQVMVQTTDNKVVLLEGEAVTFSVEDGNIQDLVYVDTLADSAALVIYNRI